MSQARTISLLNRGQVIPVPITRPAKAAGVVTPKVDCVILENPTPEQISSYRSADWKTAFESFQLVSTTNGLRTHHFMRLEKESPRSSVAH